MLRLPILSRLAGRLWPGRKGREAELPTPDEILGVRGKSVHHAQGHPAGPEACVWCRTGQRQTSSDPEARKIWELYQKLRDKALRKAPAPSLLDTEPTEASPPGNGGSSAWSDRGT